VRALLALSFLGASSASGHMPGDRIGDAGLSQLSGPNGLVVITSDAECPVSQRYRSRIQEFAARLGKEGIALVVLDMTPGARDPNRALAESLRVETTAEIQQVALRLMASGGPDAITLRAIAREMGMQMRAAYAQRQLTYS